MTPLDHFHSLGSIESTIKDKHGRFCRTNLILALTAAFCYVIYRYFFHVGIDTTFMGSGLVALGRRGPKVSPLGCFSVLEFIVAAGLFYVWTRDSGLKAHQLITGAFGAFGLIQILKRTVEVAIFESTDAGPPHYNLPDFAFGIYVWGSHLMYGFLPRFDDWLRFKSRSSQE